MTVILGLIGIGLCLTLALAVSFAMETLSSIDQCQHDDRNAAPMTADEWAETQGEELP